VERREGSLKRRGSPFRETGRKRPGRIRCAAAALGAAILLLGCATRPKAVEEGILFELGSVETQALDPYRIRFSFTLSAENRGKRAYGSLSAYYALSFSGVPAASGSEELPALRPGESWEARLERTVDIRDFWEEIPGREELPDLSWALEAEFRETGEAGGLPLRTARAEGTCTRVREPELAIKSIILVKHELINVLLELVLDVRNPNAFPLDFDSASYQFYGEGRRWSKGSAERPATIPARGTAEVRLPLLLNFTETGRDLFDLVAKLKVVRYRLSGEAEIATPLAFLPEFRMVFDKSGAVQVERSLPSEP